jgi:hypothetical protein
MAQLSQIAAVKASSVSQAKLSCIENGRALPSPDEVRALAAAYGADQTEAERLAQLAAEREIQFVDARVVLQAGRAHHFQQRVGEAEFGANLVRSYQPTMVLGVLQTPAYVSAVFSPVATCRPRTPRRRSPRVSPVGSCSLSRAGSGA